MTRQVRRRATLVCSRILQARTRAHWVIDGAVRDRLVDNFVSQLPNSVTSTTNFSPRRELNTTGIADTVRTALAAGSWQARADGARAFVAGLRCQGIVPPSGRLQVQVRRVRLRTGQATPSYGRASRARGMLPARMCLP